jgi:hypothetical protein
MPIYQITPIANNASNIDVAILSKIEEASRYKLPNNLGWFVNYKGTAVELSNLLGVTGQPEGVPATMGSTLIVAIVSYYGRGSLEMWEWLKTRFEAQG